MRGCRLVQPHDAGRPAHGSGENGWEPWERPVRPLLPFYGGRLNPNPPMDGKDSGRGMKKLPLHSAVHPFLRLQLGRPGPLGRGRHQHLGHRAGNGLRRPHRRGPDGGLLRSAGGGGGLYRERNRHHGEILRQTSVPALRQRPGTTGKLSTPWNPPGLARPCQASPRLKITGMGPTGPSGERRRTQAGAPRLVAGDARSPGRPGNACSFPSRPVPVPHCPHPGTTPRLQISSPDSWGGRPQSGTARPSRSRRPRQTTR